MVEFLTTSRISVHLEQIIMDAEDRVVIVSPYLKVDPRIIEHLEDAAKRGVSIRVIHGKRKLRPNEEARLKPLSSVHSGMELYFRENLHAKLYMNESKAILTSMNLHEFSLTHNDEMGVLVSLETDQALYRDIKRETDRIYNHSKVSPSAPARATPTKEVAVQIESRPVSEQTLTVTGRPLGIPYHGFCIRCQNIVPLEPLKPYCSRCFAQWSKYGNTEFGDRYCHICGDHRTTTTRKPLCLRCYRIYQGELLFYGDIFS